MTGRTILLYCPAMLEHDPGRGHPERPLRLEAVVDRLRRSPRPGLEWAEPNPAPREAVERIHDPAYVRWVESFRGRSARLDVDTAVSPGSVEAAWRAAGAAVEAIDAVVSGSARRAFALVRPPGHHAERAAAMGFCLFNNVAVGASHAAARRGCRRVLIVDWDVHHGNGTQHSFETRPDVLYFSTHRYPFYPGTGALHETGAGEGEGFTVNVPLPAGSGDGEYEAIFRRVLAPVSDAFAPDLVLVSAGFDAHRDDPMGGMAMTASGFASLCGIVRGIADGHAGGRLVLVLEGGYDLEALAESCAACTGILCGDPPPAPAADGHNAEALLEKVRAVQRRYWPL
jgi:acetoin utilization deacetylase AcuC-like enzyme